VSPRIIVLGAFPYPVPQGSQIYAGDQARALHRTGARVVLCCYGRGAGPPCEPFPVVTAPPSLSPRRLRAGASAAKPLADAALVARLVALARRERPHAVLAHNAEAALVALTARALTGVPVVYVAHTLWRHELPTYAGFRDSPGRTSAPDASASRKHGEDRSTLHAFLLRAGAALDATVAARADAAIALSERAATALRPHARGPVEVLPPGLDPAEPPSPEEVAAACKRHGLAPRRFVVYAGNLDRYQHLEDLAAAARHLAGVPVVAATHDPHTTEHLAPLRIVLVASARETRALVHGAAVCVLPRRIHGGFPVKLLNYMEAARPIVARTEVADGFAHERDALLLGRDAGPTELAEAIERLLADPDLALRLGTGARALLERRHAWPDLARRTLALAEQVHR